ncbi:MAG: peptidoglycan DD-metalloendopeptidase family protein [Candidatus Omnitrophica bacterium]|nr:peptidoglycan DD-metalloendopeptidase family protein [Candidatus Omnitrophota bacterium]
MTRYPVFCILGFFVLGCASAPSVTQIPQVPPTHPSGIYHTVEQGQTLWSIAKTYNIEVEDLVDANRIPDAARIEQGQRLLILGAQKPQKTAPRTAKTAKSPITGPKDETFSWPLRGIVVGYYGNTEGQVARKGIDIKAAEGTGIRASRSGQVQFASDQVRGLGKLLIVEHAEGYSTVYGHVDDILVNVGDWVEQNQVIAQVGSTGRATEPTLHFEIRKKHVPQNPLHYLP